MNDTNIRKLFYLSCHRGCKELDIILGGFAHKTKLQFDNDTMYEIYEKFLQESDYDIYNWIVATKIVPEQYKNLVDIIIS